jgi:multimeric flavodoxin WrbA
MASPVYFGDLSGQLKCFFDRTYSFFNPDFSSRLPKGKKAVLVLAQANPDAGQYDDIFPRYQRWLTTWHGFDMVYLLRAVGVKNPGDIRQQTALLDRAASLAREMVK